MAEKPPAEGKLASVHELEQKRLLARGLLIKSRLYRFFALAFALTGVVVFITLYMRDVHGHLLEAMHDLSIIGLVLLPFLPAVLLSYLAQKTERQFAALVTKPEGDHTPPHEKK